MKNNQISWLLLRLRIQTQEAIPAARRCEIRYCRLCKPTKQWCRKGVMQSIRRFDGVRVFNDVEEM